jgi:hypothetical protein
MQHDFDDITSRIKEPPTWYDANGTPRYGEFNPRMSPNIYARMVLLIRIACQECKREFFVEMNEGPFTSMKDFHPQKVHYGDPPRHEEDGDGNPCWAGNTMNCEDLEILQCWTRFGTRDWERHPEFEGPIDEGFGRLFSYPEIRDFSP